MEVEVLVPSDRICNEGEGRVTNQGEGRVAKSRFSSNEGFSRFVKLPFSLTIVDLFFHLSLLFLLRDHNNNGDQGFAESAMEVEVLVPSDRICNEGEGRVANLGSLAMKVRVESQIKVHQRDPAMVHRKIRIIFWFARDEFNLSKAKIGYSSSKRRQSRLNVTSFSGFGDPFVRFLGFANPTNLISNRSQPAKAVEDRLIGSPKPSQMNPFAAYSPPWQPSEGLVLRHELIRHCVQVLNEDLRLVEGQQERMINGANVWNWMRIRREAEHAWVLRDLAGIQLGYVGAKGKGCGGSGAGTPAIAEAIEIGAAIDCLSSIGMQRITMMRWLCGMLVHCAVDGVSEVKKEVAELQEDLAEAHKQSRRMRSIGVLRRDLAFRVFRAVVLSVSSLLPLFVLGSLFDLMCMLVLKLKNREKLVSNDRRGEEQSAFLSRASVGSSRSSRKCTHCKKLGHTIDFCWDFHPEKKNRFRTVTLGCAPSPRVCVVAFFTVATAGCGASSLVLVMAEEITPKTDVAIDAGIAPKSENLPFQVTPIRLTKDNYLSWSAALEIGITSRGRLPYITGDKPAPSKTDPQWANWALEDSQVKVWIISLVSADIQPLILWKPTSFEMWNVLARMYGRKKRVLRTYQIKRSIYALKQGDMSVASYYAALKTKWEELDYHVEDNWDCGSDHARHWEKAHARHWEKDHARHWEKEWMDRTFLFLGGLRDEFESIQSQILNCDEIPGIEDVYARVESEEQRRQVMQIDPSRGSGPSAFVSRSSMPGQRPARRCTHCNKLGHSADFCWDLHPEKRLVRGRPPSSRRGPLVQESNQGGSSSSEESRLSQYQIKELQAYIGRLSTTPEDTSTSDGAKLAQALVATSDKGAERPRGSLAEVDKPSEVPNTGKWTTRAVPFICFLINLIRLVFVFAALETIIQMCSLAPKTLSRYGMDLRKTSSHDRGGQWQSQGHAGTNPPSRPLRAHCSGFGGSEKTRPFLKEPGLGGSNAGPLNPVSHGFADCHGDDQQTPWPALLVSGRLTVPLLLLREYSLHKKTATALLLLPPPPPSLRDALLPMTTKLPADQ
ncbi:hypothetical protein EJ110_NYTH54374 [Nymphaea thermarum]|nr:hypothetical protein EJ110_NYTH54374 [Nymphaea thermarum]